MNAGSLMKMFSGRFWVLFVINTVALLMTAISANIISTWLEQNLFESGFSTLFILIPLVIFAICNGVLFIFPDRWRGHEQQLPQKEPMSAIAEKISSRHTKVLPIVVYGVTGALLLAVAVAIFVAIANPLTLYFVLDNTERMQPYIATATEEITKVLAFHASNVQTGLRIYGAPITDSMRCPVPNTFQEVPLGYLQDTEPLLQTKLAQLSPTGNGSMTTAVLETINDDLRNVSGRIRVIVVTAGFDPICDAIGGGTLESLSQSLLEQRPTIDMSILRIGRLSPVEDEVFQEIASVFGGRYFPVNVDELQVAIQSISSYGGSYFDEQR
jgi:membrane-associated phospholipid phosphatase